MTKIAIGIPYYGTADAQWWAHLVNKVGVFPKMGLEYGGMITSGAMLTDKNRNDIVKNFLKTDTEWLFWIDTDNIIPDGAINRLLGLNKTLASGLYFGKGKGHVPIAYTQIPETGAYREIHKVTHWERGEILPIDSCGFGCMLTHRSVFEDIEKSFIPLQRMGGGLTLVHKDDMIGKAEIGKKHKNDGKVINGQQFTRLIPPTIDNFNFPHFVLEYNRTEDMKFFEVAERVGHKPWLDTSVECGHLRTKGVTGKDFREARLLERVKQ